MMPASSLDWMVILYAPVLYVTFTADTDYIYKRDIFEAVLEVESNVHYLSLIHI